MNCKRCGKPAGSNKNCHQCLQYIIDEEAASVDETKARETASSAEQWLGQAGQSAPTKLFNTVKLLVSLVQEYVRGTYREIPWPTIVAITAALIYVVSPIDLVPDFIPVIGWVDDAAVVALVVKAIAYDLRLYCQARGWDPADYGI